MVKQLKVWDLIPSGIKSLPFAGNLIPPIEEGYQVVESILKTVQRETKRETTSSSAQGDGEDTGD